MPEVYKSFSPEKYECHYMVEKKHEGLRLDQFIKNYFPSFSRELIKKKIDRGEIAIKDRDHPKRPSIKVHEGEIVTFVTFRSEIEDEYWAGEKVELETVPQLLFEDEKLLIISKPPFMAVHPTGKHLFHCVTTYFDQTYPHPVHSIHRLDRETSGILVLTKNPQTANQISRQFEEGTVKKCYFFIALKSTSSPIPDSFWARERLGKTDLPNRGINKDDDNRLSVKCHPEDSDEGKEALTFFKKIYEEENTFIGLAFPQTGRQHQIRAHAAHHGLPLLGDKLYLGGARLFGRFKDRMATQDDHHLMQIPRHALHAVAINLEYEGERKTFIDSLPQDLSLWIKENLTLPYEKLLGKVQQEVTAYFTNGASHAGD